MMGKYAETSNPFHSSPQLMGPPSNFILTTQKTNTGVAPVEFTSLNYPSNYDNDESCDWTITVPRRETVNLEFAEFDTERGYDFVTVYEGDTTDGRVLGRFSGSTKP